MDDWCQLCEAYGNVHDPAKHARSLRDEGMAVADAHAHPAWKAVADATILELARSGRVFGAEDVTAIAGMPAQPNAVGARFSSWARKGVIYAAGFEQSGRASRHASRQLTWKGTAKAFTISAPPVELKSRQPEGQQSIFEPGWHCPNCDTEIDVQYVTVWSIAPSYGQASCPKCQRKVTVQLR